MSRLISIIEGWDWMVVVERVECRRGLYGEWEMGSGWSFWGEEADGYGIVMVGG